MTTPPPPLPPTPDPTRLTGFLDDGVAAVNDAATRTVLVGGIKIGAAGLGDNPGTIACFVQDIAHPEIVYALTVMHLLGDHANSAQLTPGGVKVGHPTGVDNTCSNDIIGTLDVGIGISPGKDAALVRLKPGTRWSPAIEEIGPVRGTATATLDGTYQVMKRGFRTGLTGGFVLPDANHPPIDSTGIASVNLQIVIRPNPLKTAGHNTFIQPGDSGSALVNAQGQVVGLNVRRDPNGFGYAHPIGSVFARFQEDHNLTLRVLAIDPNATTMPVFTVPGATTVAIPRELADRLAADAGLRATFRGGAGRAPVGGPWFTDVPPHPDAMARALADLGSTPGGRALLAMWERHRAELTSLLYQDRRLMLVWQRGGGAALVQLGLRMLTHPAEPLPRTLHGEPLMACIDKAQAELRRCASPELRADLARARAIAPDLAGLDYRGVLAALAAAPAEELSDR